MSKKRTLSQVMMALMILGAFLVQGTWALAGTTGGLSGIVTGANGAPIAGAAVKVTSPSQTMAATTDAGGHFNFLSLAPDTYTVTVDKSGYNTTSYSGVTIFADQSLTLSFKLSTALKTIAHTTSRAAGNLVKPGTTADIYSVNAATQTAVQGIGGGYNLDSAYSAIYSQPGVTSYIGNYGFGQVYYIRGSSYSQTGYEYDGVPVNRAFDNYNANSLSNVGAQETEVYTGGSPAGGASATLGGYINQVIKTGTYPGYANLNAGIGAPGFYHKFGVEAGGATPDRLFSYYVGIQGSNQTYNTLDNSNGVGQPIDGSGPNGIFSSSFNAFAGIFNNWLTGPYSTCTPTGAPSGSTTFNALGPALATCNLYTPWSGSGFLGVPIQTQDRENVMNFHFGIPHHGDAGRDDVQALFYNFAYHQYFGDSINDQGGPAYLNQAFPGWGGPAGVASLFGVKNYPGESGPYSDLCAFQALFFPGCATSGGSTLPYIDSQIFAPGTTFGQAASTATPVTYYAPSQPTNRAVGAGVPLNGRDTTWNDGTVLKLQYQKNIGSNAYVRLMGYSFYSDWLMSAPNVGNAFITGYGYGDTGFAYPAPDYELNTHTRGLQLQAADQINPENLLSFTGNYTTATVTRWNNQWYGAPGGVTNLVGSDGTTCYNYTTGAASNCLLGSTAGTYAAPVPGAPPAGSPAALAGATFIVTRPGAYGPVNNVTPRFSSLALTDEWRPNDKLDINAGLRYENYTYDLPSTVNSEFNFWFNQAANAYCYNPATGYPALNLVPPGSPPSSAGPIVDPNVQYGLLGLNPGLCYTTNAAGAVVPYVVGGAQLRHPNGLSGSKLYTNAGPSVLSHSLWSPRIGGTYTLDPDTVVRFNYGRYTQPTETAFEQYSNASGLGAAKFDFHYFWGLGFTTPAHDNPVQVSNNYDLSLEKHLKGTDWTFKLSPFYRYTTNQLVTVSLGANFASGFNAGTQRTQGVELAIQKGDPTRNGFSGQLNYTYTNAKLKYNSLPNGTNAIDVINNYIKAYNALTGAGGGSPWYCANGLGPVGDNQPVQSPASCGKAAAIVNPYFGDVQQGLLDRNGWYDPYANNPPQSTPDLVTDTAISPNVFAGFLSYKRNKFTASVNAQLNQGQSYGSPLSVSGLDPRFCSRNEAMVGVVPPGSAFSGYGDYQSCAPSLYVESGTLAIPNPQTGSFAGLGMMREPWQLNMGLQFGYDVTPKVHATLTLANVVNTCFGGSPEPWTAAYKPNGIVCVYAPNSSYYIGNQPGAGFFYGASGASSANGTAGYPAVFNQSYQPLYGAIPFQAYVNVQIKL